MSCLLWGVGAVVGGGSTLLGISSGSGTFQLSDWKQVVSLLRSHVPAPSVTCDQMLAWLISWCFCQDFMQNGLCELWSPPHPRVTWWLRPIDHIINQLWESFWVSGFSPVKTRLSCGRQG